MLGIEVVRVPAARSVPSPHRAAVEEARDQGRAGVDRDEPALRLRRLEEGLELRQRMGFLQPVFSQARRFRREAFSATSAAPIAASIQVEGSGTIDNRPLAGSNTRYCPRDVSGVYQLPLALCPNVSPE